MRILKAIAKISIVVATIFISQFAYASTELVIDNTGVATFATTTNISGVFMTYNDVPVTGICGYSTGLLYALYSNQNSFGVSTLPTNYNSDLHGNYTVYLLPNGFSQSGCGSGNWPSDIAGIKVNAVYSIPFHYDGVNYVPVSAYQGGTGTRIISLTPENGTTTGSTVSFNMQWYIDPDDIGSVIGVAVSFHNIDENVITSSFSPNDKYFMYDVQATSSGYMSFSSTTQLADGNYRINGKLTRTYLNLFKNPFSPISTSVSNTFIVNNPTWLGTLQQGMFKNVQALWASTTATTTVGTTGYCNIGTFDFTGCVGFLFIPDKQDLQEKSQLLWESVSTSWPLGYVLDFYNQLQSATATSLTVLDVTVPNGLPFGGGQHLTLDMTHKLDYILNATTTIFGGAGGTLYDTTLPYWQFFVYFSAFLYMLSRIIGTSLIPRRGDHIRAKKV